MFRIEEESAEYNETEHKDNGQIVHVPGGIRNRTRVRCTMEFLDNGATCSTLPVSKRDSSIVLQTQTPQAFEEGRQIDWDQTETLQFEPSTVYRKYSYKAAAHM